MYTSTSVGASKSQPPGQRPRISDDVCDSTFTALIPRPVIVSLPDSMSFYSVHKVS